MSTGINKFIQRYFELGVLLSVILSLIVVLIWFILRVTPSYLNFTTVVAMLYASYEVIEGVLGWGIERSFWKDKWEFF